MYEPVIELHIRPEHKEQDHPGITFPVLADADRFHDFGKGLHLTIDLGGADADASWIEHCIAATMNDVPVVFRGCCEIAVRPNLREALEIGGPITIVVSVFPEANGCRRKGSGTDQLTFLLMYSLALGIPDFNRHAKTRRLQLTFEHREQGIAQNEAGNQVSTTTHGNEVKIGLDVAIDVTKAFMGQGRACRDQHPYCRKVMSCPWLHTLIFDALQEFRADPEHVDPFTHGKIEHRRRVRKKRRAVVKNNATPCGQR